MHRLLAAILCCVAVVQCQSVAPVPDVPPVVVPSANATGAPFDTFTGLPISRQRYEQLRLYNMTPMCAVTVEPCDPLEWRRPDGSCNNLKHPQRGTAYTPFRRMMLPHFSTRGLPVSQSGRPLPPVRPLRVAIMSDGQMASDKYTILVGNFNMHIAADITSIHDTVNYIFFIRHCCSPAGRLDRRCIPIQIPDDDLHLRLSNVRCLNLTRSVTYQQVGCVPDSVLPERLTSATPMLDLSMIYGGDARRARRGRSLRGGRLRAVALRGKDWPPTGGAVCFNNEPPRETWCNDTPSSAANSLLGVSMMFLWFYRSHNAIARKLEDVNPCWDDERLYATAMEINIAISAQITYYELMPSIIGWDFLLKNKIVFETLGHVDDYEPSLEPRVSIEFLQVMRWFHTIQEGRVKLYTPEGRLYDEKTVVDFTFRTGALVINNTIQGITQGVFRQPGAGADRVIDPDMGERALGRLQFASDVLSSDIMKNRDSGLPTYNQIRRTCGMPEVNTFKDLLGWMDKSNVDALSRFYEDPGDIELFMGVLSERPMEGAMLGPTMACVVAEQLRWWRRSDRFWYEHTDRPQAFAPEQLLEIRKMTMAKLLCLHGDSVIEVQPNAFYIIGHGNDLASCDTYDYPNLEVFYDASCSQTKLQYDHNYF